MIVILTLLNSQRSMATTDKSMLVPTEHEIAKRKSKTWLETEKGKGRVVQRFIGDGSTSAGVQHIPALSNV